jgi:hypothetical protein
MQERTIATGSMSESAGHVFLVVTCLLVMLLGVFVFPMLH